MSLKNEKRGREKYVTLKVNDQKLAGMVHFPSGRDIS
jgi:hypothetical protein